MRKLLLNPTPLFRKLRQLSMLLTLLLALPQTAWGQEVTKTYTFTGTTLSGNAGTATSTTGNATQNWEFKNFSITNNRAGYVISSDSLKISNIIYYDSHEGPTTVAFDLMSDFTLTGAFVSAEITYCTNKMETKTVTIAKNEGTYNSLLTDDNEALGATPTTISLNSSHANNRNFNGNKISFHFSFTTITPASGNQQDASFTIQSIKITTGPIEYDLKVENTQVTAGNASNILAGTANDGKVSYDATQNILTLNEANLTMPIQTNINNLIIELKGENKINADADNAIKRISSNETLNLTIRPASTAPLGGIHLANSASASPNIPLIDGFNVTLGGSLFASEPLSNSSTHNTYIASLLVGTQMVTQTGYVFSSNTKISFDNASSTNVLTISEVTDDLKYSKIISGLSNLTINFNGANTIEREDTCTAIMSTNNSSVLTFTKATDGSTLSISNVAGEHSIIHGFSSINYGDGIYLTTSVPTTYVNTPNKGLMSALDNTKPINSLSLSSNPSYQLWVAGTQATSTTSGTGWSYDAANNKLTLDGGTNGITIIGQIISGLGDLSIHIKGNVTLKASGSETNLIKSTNNGGLTFETDASIGNNLYFKNSSNEKFGDNSIYGFTTVAYEAGLGYYSQFSEITEVLYIEYNSNKYKLHSSNKSDIVGDGKVSFSHDSTNGNVLTLNNANIEVIEWRIDNDLTVALNGANVITSDATAHTYSINYYGNLNIVKASGATSAELRTSTNGYTPINTTNLTLGSGLYLKPISNSSTTITDNPEFVLFNGYAMTNGQTINKTNPAGSLVYTESGSEKTLTFTNFQDAFGNGNSQVNAIETGVVGLKVVLIGDNSITCNDPNTYAFKGIQNNASIQFVKGGDGCKLTMNMNTTANPLSFGNGKITYDKLIYSDVNGKIICEPTAPTMGYNDQEKVTLGKTYTDGDIYYTITYADGKTANVAKTKYTAEFALDAPGTVEAWVEANGATTSTVKGKHFGYKDAPFVMAVNETKTPVLIPAFEAGDNIEIAASDPYTSSDTGVATFANGVITAVSSGTATLTTKLAITSGANSSIVVLNSNSQFNTTVKVATDISSCFQDQNNYGTYYNTADNYTIPAGMEAYIVTGVSGNQVVLKSLSILPKQTALLLFKGTATSFNSVTTNETADTSENILMHADATVTATEKEYILYKDEFVKATGTIPTGKCYLYLTGVAPARGMYGIGNDGSTAIEGIDVEATEDETWYDLQGRRIQKPTKAGIYIVNGKKVIINNK